MSAAASLHVVQHDQGCSCNPIVVADVLHQSGEVKHTRYASALLAGVSDTIRKEITDVQAPTCWACGYCDSKMSLYMLGMSAALLATAVFLILSSATSMPVSTTHAVVGAVLGMTAAGTAPRCLQLWPLARIVASWIVSPLLAGVLGSALYSVLQRYVILSSRARLLSPCSQCISHLCRHDCFEEGMQRVRRRMKHYIATSSRSGIVYVNSQTPTLLHA